MVLTAFIILLIRYWTFSHFVIKSRDSYNLCIFLSHSHSLSTSTSLVLIMVITINQPILISVFFIISSCFFLVEFLWINLWYNQMQPKRCDICDENDSWHIMCWHHNFHRLHYSYQLTIYVCTSTNCHSELKLNLKWAARYVLRLYSTTKT